jgi:glycosyltransferase involved in cell wall biosynthesis
MEFTAVDKLRGLAKLTRIIRAVGPHLIHAENYHANLFTRLTRPLFPQIKLVGTIRGVYSPKQLLYARLGQPLTTVVAANAPHLKTMMEQQAGYPPEKVITIRAGVNLQRFAAPHDPGLRQRIAPNARRLLVTVGRVSAEKNIHETVQAFGLLKRSNRLPEGSYLVILGPVQEAQAQRQIEQAVSEDALEKVVIQHRETRYPEDYYFAADATILYSPSEGLPSVVLESLAAGRPAVVSAKANAARIIEHNKTGWMVENGDIPALADTLYEVLTMPDAALATFQLSSRKAAEGFAVERSVDQFMDLYDRL